jgi:hypothetical protein
MIILLEPDENTCRRLCKIMPREKIITVPSVTEIFEMICKYKREIDLIIANLHVLAESSPRQVVERLCQKLAIEVPPILCYYKQLDKKIRHDNIKENKQIQFIKYNEKDENFPEKLIQIIKQIYPGLNADANEAKASWFGKPKSNITSIQKWLKEEKSRITKMPQGSETDYRKLYHDLQKKYDELLKIISEIIDTVDDSEDSL